MPLLFQKIPAQIAWLFIKGASTSTHQLFYLFKEHQQFAPVGSSPTKILALPTNPGLQHHDRHAIPFVFCTERRRLKPHFQFSVNSSLVFLAPRTLSRCGGSVEVVSPGSNKLCFCLINRFYCWYLGSQHWKQVWNPVFLKFCVRQFRLDHFYVSHFLVYPLPPLKMLGFNLFS